MGVEHCLGGFGVASPWVTGGVPLAAGGGNIPAVNDLLSVFGIGFGDALLEGQLAVGEEKIYYASGVNIARFPAGGTLHAAQLADKAVVGELRTPRPPSGTPCLLTCLQPVTDDNKGGREAPPFWAWLCVL